MAHPDISSDTPGKAPGASAPGPKLHHPRGLTRRIDGYREEQRNQMCLRATPYRNLRAVVCVGRLPDPTTVFAGPALLANIRNQNEHEALAARRLATWPSQTARSPGWIAPGA